MKRFLKVFLILLAGAGCALSCKQEDYFIFNEHDRLQFGPDPSRIYQTSFDYADTLKPYTFYYEDENLQQDTVFFDLYTIGGVSGHDRPFKLEQEQVAGEVNATPGIHYKAFDHPELAADYVIKAGTVHTSVPIVLLRDPSLKEETVLLKFKVVPNDEFLEGEATKIWRKVRFTDRLSQPASWNASAVQYYYGAYSVTKHEFMINSTGEKWDEEFMSALPSDYGLMQYWIGVLKTKLVDYNNDHPCEPLTD